MTTFPRRPTQLDRPHSGSSHRTSLTPSTRSTAPRESTTTPPRTPSPHLSNPPSLTIPHPSQGDGLPSIRIDDDDQRDHEKGLKRRKSLERTRSWAEEVERNRKRSERNGKERVKNVRESDNSPYGQPFWSVSTEVIDSLVEALGPSSSDLSHLPSAAQVIAANRRRSYRIDTDSDEGKSGEDDEWWNEESYRQKDRSTSMRLQVVQPPQRERRSSERTRKASNRSEKVSTKSTASTPFPTSKIEKIALIPLPSPTTPTTPVTPSTPARTPTTPILSIDDIIRKHSPGVTNAENAVKEKARKEIEEVRPRLASIRPKSMDVLSQTPKELDDEIRRPIHNDDPRKDITTGDGVASPQRSPLVQDTGNDLARSRKISFLQSTTQSGPLRTNSLPNVKPILRTSQSTHNAPQKRPSNTQSTPIQASKNENESLESLSREAKMTSALLDQLEQLEKASTITSTSSAPSSSKRISFQISSERRSSIRPMTPTRVGGGNGNNKLSKRKSMPESSLIALQSQAETEAQNLSYAVYLRSTHLNRIVTLPRPYPEKPLHVSLAEVGNPSGKPVIVFLGLGCVRYLIALFDDIAKTFNLRLICIDRWGFGKTDQVPSDKRNPLDWAEVVIRVLDQLGVREFQVLAHSAGAPYAMATALKMQERIKGKVHLLAPWVGADIDGGYKWLKYIPKTVIKSATAAEWKLQSYLIGKPPPLKHKPISHNASAPVSSGDSSRTNTPLPEEADEQDPLDGISPGRSRERRTSILRSTRDSRLGSPGKLTRPQTSPGLMRRSSKKILIPGRPSDTRNEDRPASVPSSQSGIKRSASPTKDPRIASQFRQDSENSLSTSTSSSLRTPTSRLSMSMSISQESKARSSSVLGLGKDEDVRKELDIYHSEGFDLRSSNSLDSRFVTSPIARSALLRAKSYTTSSSSSPDSKGTSDSADYDYGSSSAPTGEGFTTALTQASHAECEPGTTSDLLSIVLNRDNRQWGFSYTDYTGAVKVFYGSLDDKISEKSMRWMERSMSDVELIVKGNEGHGLMTSLRVMWDVFESLGRDARGR
ncbi:hypothetical protein I302_104953 [Kwoniella bestiolae CBS 10118]|uniref:AB hydrolase-1 domain-containing protein n=1 Tax=Kwoniella bestiolae CBS 10118 TaxID=1296100 RepID=A0A1B9FRB2_9TREE|nr:hypothetical protein I302_08977 [Kwoniella bestiolae CBS 10118]OCF21304.1 hypothetical protein I302_08977 [Kwoniella bestiolae CBS 10118]